MILVLLMVLLPGHGPQVLVLVPVLFVDLVPDLVLNTWHSAVSQPLTRFSPQHPDAASKVVVAVGEGKRLWLGN